MGILVSLAFALACTPALWAQTNDASAGGPAVAVAASNDARPVEVAARPALSPAVAAWQVGRTCFDRADAATNDTERAEVAQKGIAACRQALEHDSNSAAAHYYLGLNMGELARTETLGALKLVRQMEREFTTARNLDQNFDYAGPDRCLGLLYRDAPSFGSIGSRTKARQHLERAVQLAPDYPENRLNLLESYLTWGEHDNAQRELTQLESLLPTARTKFSGPAWSSSWTDWDSRLQAARRKLEQPSRKLETPRH